MKNECLGLLLEELAEGLKNDVIEVLLFTTASSSSSSDLENKGNKYKPVIFQNSRLYKDQKSLTNTTSKVLQLNNRFRKQSSCKKKERNWFDEC